MRIRIVPNRLSSSTAELSGPTASDIGFQLNSSWPQLECPFWVKSAIVLCLRIERTAEAIAALGRRTLIGHKRTYKDV